MKQILFLALIAVAMPAANAQLYVSSFLVNFYDQPVNSYGAQSSVYVQNNGTEPVQVNVTSNCFADFTLTNDCNLTLNQNMACSLTIRFQPRQFGQQSCMIQVGDNAGDHAIIDVSGRGVRKD